MRDWVVNKWRKCTEYDAEHCAADSVNVQIHRSKTLFNNKEQGLSPDI